MGILEWLELTALGTFVRESPSFFAFPTFLFLHTIGLSLVVGTSTIVALRVLGIVPDLPLRPLERLFPFGWAGFAIATFSGVGLAIADATNKLLNPIVIGKLVMVLAAGICMWLLERRVFRSQGSKEATPEGSQLLAAAMMFFWVASIIGGRLIAYWRTILNI